MLVREQLFLYAGFKPFVVSKGLLVLNHLLSVEQGFDSSLNEAPLIYFGEFLSRVTLHFSHTTLHLPHLHPQSSLLLPHLVPIVLELL